MRRTLASIVVIASLLPADAIAQQLDPAVFKALTWREVGPFRGGRSAAVTGVTGDVHTYYMGACGGGVWKTTDSGRSWKPISDEFFGGSVGAVAVADSDPNVVYVGGGEKTLRGNVSHGDGMWRSNDAGRTWKKIGLADSRHICRVRVHPSNPELVYAAALGHLHGPNSQRGVFRSRDGGATWGRILHVSDDAGAVDLAMDPTNPRILYATLWQVRRTPWTLESGGEGSGIWKSTDGGDSWDELTDNPGLPKGTIGICGISVSRSNPDNVYAIVEAEAGGVFRSRDAGKTWRCTNKERSLRQRAWYYTRIFADPGNEDTVYVLNVGFHRSVDGGRTFRSIRTPHGDNHDLWIAPDDPQRMIESNDGGANVSHDGGVTWSPQDNQPTAQMYRLSTDEAFPYRLLGGQQDNSALRIRSRGLTGGAIGIRDWEPTAGGESGHVVAKPDDPDLVFGGSYGGFLTWLDHRTGARRSVNVWPDNPMGWGAAELRYRFQWNFPLFFSPHDPGVLYAAGNVLFRSEDLGASWQAISPDLTRDDKDKQGPSGGPITKDNTSVEYYCTIFAAAESPLEPGVLWAGTDDGLIHISRDGGGKWNDVTPADLPEWAQINSLDVDPTRKGGLYVAATRYKSDDFAPYLYRTVDYGKTWTKIVEGIDPDHFTRVIRADPERVGLLYAGTERGVYVSFDDGGRWQQLQQKLPVVPVTDLAVKRGDLVAATQGRGFWILDDLSPLHQLSEDLARADAHLFEPRATHRLPGGRARGGGSAPPSGVLIPYLLADAPAAEVECKLDIMEADGDVIRSFTRKPAPGENSGDGGGDNGGGGGDGGRRRGGADNTKLLSVDKGLNRFAWDMRYSGAERFPGMVLWNSRMTGPLAVPGTYQAKLTVGDWSATVPFEIRPDPRSRATAADRQAQFNFALEVRDKLTQTHQAIGRIRAVRKELAALRERTAGASEGGAKGGAEGEGVVAGAKALEAKITKIEEALYQTKSKSRQDPLNFPIRLNDKLAGLLSAVASGDYGPTRQAQQVRDELVFAIDAQLDLLDQVWTRDLPALNRQAVTSGVPAVGVEKPAKPAARAAGGGPEK